MGVDRIGNRWVDTKLVIQAYSIRELLADILLDGIKQYTLKLESE